MKNTDLLPCPFCGGEGRIMGNMDHGPFFVFCWGGCGSELGMKYDRRCLPEHKFKTVAEAVIAWNTRKSKP